MNPVVVKYVWTTDRERLLAAAREAERIAAEYQRLADELRSMA